MAIWDNPDLPEIVGKIQNFPMLILFKSDEKTGWTYDHSKQITYENLREYLFQFSPKYK